MNFRNAIIGLLGVLFFGTSCSKESVSPAAGEGTVQLKVSQTAVAGPTGYGPENTVKNARIFIFRDGRLETMRVFSGAELAALACELRVRTGTSDVHVLLNAPDAMVESLSRISTPADLQALTYRIADFLTDADKSLDDVNAAAGADYVLPWYGVTTGVTITAEETRTLQLDVYRAVARVDLYLRRQAGSGLTCKIDPAESRACLRINKLFASGYVASGRDDISDSEAVERVIRRGTSVELPVAPEGATSGAPNTQDYRLAYSFYVPEQYFATASSLPVFQIEGTQWGDEGWIPELDPDVEGPYRFTFGDGIANFDNRMSRNTVYTLFGTLTQQGFLVGFTLQVQPWNYKQQQGDIG